ncbi:TraM recognition domain-containing protein [Pseudomonas savastanoi pv. phaseolicola]|uniref:TraM recognition domain-containing protein n=1 Tax=Pseudomonas savastanoi TaxID=29438 RepID=UPI00031A8FA1|nr:TraM recognition domain-containing protein [Pseudomonas savastanoi]MBN3470682.1 TraM recognition domain-containing protein [Pseudomonas savastanoi pv. phaseolicola]MBN3477708.1 TraM recognition domain-containing protein [Pseudomonas savastanoi pv. phaseolicola]
MELLRQILLNTNPGLATVFAFMLGLMIVLSVSGAVRETDERTAFDLSMIFLRRAILIILFVTLPVFMACLYGYAYVEYGYDWYKANRYMALFFGELRAAIGSMWWSLIVVLVLPMFLRALAGRFIRPAISNFLRRFRVKQSADALSDIRIEVGRIKPKDFTPSHYYKDDYFFLGLGEDDEPIYMEDEIFRKNHKKVLGPSQTGKGVLLGVLIDQAIRKGWGVWFIDQKPDDFICDIMRESCARNKRPEPTYVDLNGIGPGSYAPFVFGTRRERSERLVKSFALGDTGTTADYYKQNERKVVHTIMPLWDGTLSHLDQLIKGKHPELSESTRNWIRNNCGSIESNLLEFMQLDTLRATEDESFNVSEALTRGDVVYVRSHMKDSIVRKACIALLDELVQVALRKPLPKPVFLVLDECRFIVSDTLADSLATLLSKGINAALAYQGPKDLLNLPDKSQNAESIKDGMVTNTQVTLSYRANDFETATWVSDQTGVAQMTVNKMEKVEVRNGAEVWGDERSLGQEPENQISTNVLLALPPRVCALIRPNHLSVVLYTAWIAIEEAKGLPPRDSGTANPVNQKTESPMLTTTVIDDDQEDDDEDPFGITAEAELSETDPFESQSDFDDIEPIDDDEDPFAGSTVSDNVDDFSEIERPIDDDSMEPEKTNATKKPKGKLSAQEQEAIKNALSGILASPANKPKQSEAGKAKSIDPLSSIDNIEGI